MFIDNNLTTAFYVPNKDFIKIMMSGNTNLYIVLLININIKDFIMRYCSMCGKKDITNNFINIFIDGDTSNNHPKNLKTVCVNCAKVYKTKKLYTAAKTLHKLGFKFTGKTWKYDHKIIRAEMVDIEALNHRIKFLEDENKDLKRLLGFKKEGR